MILDRFSLKGKVAIVTGSDTGLGQGFCKAFVEAGAKVMGVSVVSSQATQDMLGAENFQYMVENLMTLEPIDRIIAKTVELFGHVDILVNNAGIILREDAIDFSEEYWDKVMSVNAKTVFFFSQAVARQFIKQGGGGKIISVASMLSYQGGIRVPSYTASKSAVKGITMSMSNEWAKYGINVNSICPTVFRSELTEWMFDPESAVYKNFLNREPIGRLAEPSDCVGYALFLSSAASDFITGANCDCSGGYLVV